MSEFELVIVAGGLAPPARSRPTAKAGGEGKIALISADTPWIAALADQVEAEAPPLEI